MEEETRCVGSILLINWA